MVSAKMNVVQDKIRRSMVTGQHFSRTAHSYRIHYDRQLIHSKIPVWKFSGVSWASVFLRTNQKETRFFLRRKKGCFLQATEVKSRS
jgi:hypothetical protein